MINTSVSSIGATVALGLTFLKTGNFNTYLYTWEQECVIRKENYETG